MYVYIFQYLYFHIHSTERSGSVSQQSAHHAQADSGSQTGGHPGLLPVHWYGWGHSTQGQGASREKRQGRDEGWEGEEELLSGEEEEAGGVDCNGGVRRFL